MFFFSFGVVLYLYEKWQRIGKQVVVIMRSSNEDCDEFRRIWKIDRVLQGDLDAEERTSYCYLLNSEQIYSSRNREEWIKVEGVFTHEKGHVYYADCMGTLLLRDKTVSRITVGKSKQRELASGPRSNPIQENEVELPQ
ncbi:MAG: hypothetical protein EOO56_11795 [Hymenobacter sp.]|nr:MAG: hypothetical protein EOO56_11795 [Hymenobacter sp.]